ncbi:uncharacterized protein LOC132629033 [Lycium barbarum]|uniref:uncharacterized protein LOC132629033 n=1 Tax=Lycium barbarum TaxID=112863 RepID=UPI00293E9414|nr:uncharacterized protein LOC132629033 [Lycium barbarum]
MRRQTDLVVSCGEVLKAKSHVVVYTKERDEDEESVGSSYHVTVQDERDTLSPIRVGEELEALDEKRLEAQQSLECYQARLSRAFNKKVRLRSFQVGDQVLAVRRPIIISHKSGSKFTSKWDGPYVVQEAYTSGAYKLIDTDGLHIGTINGKFLKMYYS